MNPHVAWSIFDKDMPEIDRGWFPDGGKASSLWQAPAAAMVLAGGLQTLRNRLGFKGTDSIKDPLMKSFVQLWRDRTPKGQARLIEAVAKAIGTNPKDGDLDQFDEGFAKQDFTQFFKKIAPQFMVPGVSFNYYSSLEDPIVGSGTNVGTPIQALKIHGLFRRGYILSLNLGHYVNGLPDDPSNLYLIRWAGHPVVLVGIIYPQSGPWRFVVADPTQPKALRQLKISKITPAANVDKAFMYRKLVASGEHEVADFAFANYTALEYLDTYKIKDFWVGTTNAADVYDIIDSAVGFRVHVPDAISTPVAAPR
jgi:hypothetical protein